MSGVSSMHGGGGGGLVGGHGGLNGVKLEGPGGYYCNSYTPPAPVRPPAGVGITENVGTQLNPEQIG